MKLSAEVIQSRVFEDFEIQLNDYYKQCESDYLSEFRQRIIDGSIDVTDDYKSVCKEEVKKYKKKIDNETLSFIKNYINNTFDIIDDSLREGIFDSDEATAAFSALRHILIAAEMDYDANTKLSEMA